LAALPPMLPLSCAISLASRLISDAPAMRPLLTSPLSVLSWPLSCWKRLARVLPPSSMFCRSAVPEALEDRPLTVSKKLDHTPETLVAVSENIASRRSAMLDSCFNRASSPLPSSNREIASWSATRRMSVMRVPLPTSP